LNAGDYSVTVEAPFCRVVAHVEEAINIELWMPMPAVWNGRMLGAGVGGSAGVSNFRGLARGVGRGFATASTDTGHSVDQRNWMLDPRAASNYAHDALSALVRWVETDQAPTRLIGSRTLNGAVVRTRPLCPFPLAAKYKGSGDNSDAANFRCASPVATAALHP
jgi:hypothetical protein